MSLNKEIAQIRKANIPDLKKSMEEGLLTDHNFKRRRILEKERNQ